MIINFTFSLNGDSYITIADIANRHNAIIVHFLVGFDGGIGNRRLFGCPNGLDAFDEFDQSIAGFNFIFQVRKFEVAVGIDKTRANDPFQLHNGLGIGEIMTGN